MTAERKKHFAYWLPVVLWMSMIFIVSTNVGAPRNTSRFLGPLLHWLFSSLSEEGIGAIIYFIRKCAHATEYALLGMLIWRALYRPLPGSDRPWSWRIAAWTIGLSALYAVLDEFHQSFVTAPGPNGIVYTRQASGWDVLIDTGGAAAAMLFIWALRRWRRKW